MPNAHPLAKRKNLRLRDLANEPFIFGSRLGWETYRAFIDSVFYAAEFDPKIILEVYGSVGIFGLVAAGLGVSIYPDCQLQVQYRNFAVRPLVDVARPVETAAIWYPRTLTPPRRPLRHLSRGIPSRDGWNQTRRHAISRLKHRTPDETSLKVTPARRSARA